MLKNRVLKGRYFFLLVISLAFMSAPSAAYAGEIKEIWNHISLNDTDVSFIDFKARSIWNEFEKSSIQRGMIIKPNYQPFVPVVNRIIVLDTPAGELAYRKYSLRVETEIIDGKDARITELTLSRISDVQFPEAGIELQIGYANGRLGKSVSFWIEQKRIVPEELKAFEQLKKLENFKRSIELEYSGDIDYRRVPVEDVFYFFPEISNLKLNFDYLYPQNDKPMFKTTYEPGRIRFGSLLDSDVRISFVHNIITEKMVHGEISWKTTFSKFTTGEESGLSDSFFYFMQEKLAEANLVAPANVMFF